jgi:menaquinone-9 beta-reductase
MNLVDVAIVGAGPAGSSAAIFLARKGYSVALIDKEQFPREKLCGDFINPANWPSLRALGVVENIFARHHEKVTKFRLTASSGEEAEVALSADSDRDGAGLGLSRLDLDEILLEKAASEGATVFQRSRIKGLTRGLKTWTLEIDRGRILQQLRAPMLIGADGRNSWLAHHLGMTGRTAMRASSVGFQLHLNSSHPSNGKIEIHLFPGGYAGIVGLGDHTLTLGFAIEKSRLYHRQSPQQLLNSSLALNPHLKDILHRNQIVGAMRSTYPVYFPSRRSYGERVLLVGDAARVSEPVTGEGVYFALKSGELAALTIDQAFCKSEFSAASLHRYERDCRSAFAVRRRANALIRWLIYRPVLLAPLIRFSSTRTRLLDSVVRMICEPSPPLYDPSSLSPRARYHSERM